MQISTYYGILTPEAKWLVPAATIAKDPKDCLIAVTIELREHTIAHAARVLRESGATPAQVKRRRSPSDWQDEADDRG